jgi:hypothetical protein
MTSLEERIQHLEDIKEIETLIALYAHYANVGEGSGDPEKFAALFTDDAVWDLRQPLTGRKAIADRLRVIEKLKYIGFHFALNPRVEVEGDTAHGEWDLLFSVIIPGTTQPTNICGFYAADMVRTPEGWRFKRFKYRVSDYFDFTADERHKE